MAVVIIREWWTGEVVRQPLKLADVLGMPPEHVGAFGDMTIREDRKLAFDESYIDTYLDEAVVGELAHFVWRVEQAGLNAECRKACKTFSWRLAQTLGLH